MSGTPSTLYAFVAHRDPLEATLAAGSILRPHEHRRTTLVAAAVPVHVGVSAFWAVVLAIVLPRRRRLIEGTFAGLAIATVDLLLIGRRFPRIRALPKVPQFADHTAFSLVLLTLLPERNGT